MAPHSGTPSSRWAPTGDYRPDGPVSPLCAPRPSRVGCGTPRGPDRRALLQISTKTPSDNGFEKVLRFYGLKRLNVDLGKTAVTDALLRDETAHIIPRFSLTAPNLTPAFSAAGNFRYCAMPSPVVAFISMSEHALGQQRTFTDANCGRGARKQQRRRQPQGLYYFDCAATGHTGTLRTDHNTQRSTEPISR